MVAGRPGVLTLDITGTRVTERFTVRGEQDTHQMALGVNTPRYREWFATHRSDAGSAPEFTDPLVVSRADLATGSHTAEVTATDVHGRAFTQTLTFEVTV